MFQILKPPTSLNTIQNEFTVFLAGSIEMGGAEDWQATVSESLKQEDLTILNPRRDDWDATWEQTIENPKFREQVEWELAALEAASMIAMYFEPSTKSPITLLELGLHARSKRMVVCCPDGFWRKGNIDVVCSRFDIPMVATLSDLVDNIRRQFADQTS